MFTRACIFVNIERDVRSRKTGRKERARKEEWKREWMRNQRDSFTYKSNFVLWFRRAMNRDESTGPLTRPFACLLAPLTHLLAGSLTHSRGHGGVNDSMSQNDLILSHSGLWSLVSFIAVEILFQCLANTLLAWNRFLDASSHLYMRVCPSVCPYVRPSVGPSVGPLALRKKRQNRP